MKIKALFEEVVRNAMIIKDNDYEYDTDYIDAAVAAGDKRDSIQRDVLNAFFRHSYYLYRQIRDVHSDCKCRPRTLKYIQQNLDMDKVGRYLHLDEETVRYLLSFIEKNTKIK